MFWLFNLRIYNKILNDYKYIFKYYLLVALIATSFQILSLTIFLKSYKISNIIFLSICSVFFLISIIKLSRAFYYFSKTCSSFNKFKNYGHLICFCGEPGSGKTTSAVYFGSLLAKYNMEELKFEYWQQVILNRDNLKNDNLIKYNEIIEGYNYVKNESKKRTKLMFSNIKINEAQTKKENQLKLKTIYLYNKQNINIKYINDKKELKNKYRSKNITKKDYLLQLSNLKNNKSLNFKSLKEKYKHNFNNQKETKTISNLLLVKHLHQQFRLPYKFVGVFDEIGKYLPIELSKTPPEDLENFFRYIRHFLDGRLLVTEQDSNHIPIFIRRIASRNIQLIKTKRKLNSILFTLLSYIAEYFYKDNEYTADKFSRKIVSKIISTNFKLGVIVSNILTYSTDTSKNQTSNKTSIAMPCNNNIIYDTRAFSNLYKALNRSIDIFNYKNENSLKSEFFDK